MLGSPFSAGSSRAGIGGSAVMPIETQTSKVFAEFFPHEMPVWAVVCELEGLSRSQQTIWPVELALAGSGRRGEK